MKNAKEGPFQENSRTFPGVLSNLPIFQDAFSGLKSIQGLPRTSGHPDSRQLLVNFMAIDHLYRFER